MKNFYQALLAAFLLPLFSSAQSNYKSGYLVTLKGDTLHGFIDYREWNKNPKDIRFKEDLNSSNTEYYSIKNANAFAVTGQVYYERYILSVSQDAVDIDKVSQNATGSFIMDTVFLRILNKGKYLNLYGYTDEIKPRFYLMEAGETQPQELIYHVYYNPNESSSAQFVNRFRTQLQYSAQKYGAGISRIKGEISQSNYSQKELIKIVQEINGSSSQQFTTNQLSGTRWFAGLGANYSNLRFVEGSGLGFGGNSVTNKTSVFPKITAGIDFFANKNTRALVARADFSFTANQYKFSSRNNVSQSTSTLNFKQYNNSITPQIIYNMFNKEDLKVFVGAGASFNLSSYNNDQYVTKYDGSFPDYVPNSYPPPSRFWICFPVRAGIELNKKIEIHICYIPSSPISHSGLFSEDITSYQAGLNYFFR